MELVQTDHWHAAAGARRIVGGVRVGRNPERSPGVVEAEVPRGATAAERGQLAELVDSIRFHRD